VYGSGCGIVSLRNSTELAYLQAVPTILDVLTVYSKMIGRYLGGGGGKVWKGARFKRGLGSQKQVSSEVRSRNFRSLVNEPCLENDLDLVKPRCISK
jgi:hypothetical protein